MNTPEWERRKKYEKRRKELLKEFGNYCTNCGQFSNSITVHHFKGSDEHEFLVPLCLPCHGSISRKEQLLRRGKRICPICSSCFISDKFEIYCSEKCQVEVNRIRCLAYAVKHREEAAARARKWYELNTERAKATNKVYRNANVEKLNSRARKYREEHKEEQKAYWKKFRESRKGILNREGTKPREELLNESGSSNNG